MKTRDIKLYGLELLTIVIFFFALFASNILDRMIIAILSFVLCVIVSITIKKKGIVSIYKKQVTIAMVLFALVYVGVFYLLGIYFGFERSKILLSIWSIFKYIIPLSTTIICSELIRHKFLVQKRKVDILATKVDVSAALVYVGMVLVDLVIYTGVYHLDTLDDFLTTLGFVLFSSMSCNLLYNYASVRFGAKPVIAYRLITSLFMYVIPFTPDVYLFFRTFLRMICPYFIYLVLEKQFSNSNFEIALKDRKKSIIETSIVLAVTSLIVALVSCKFTYGILVVGSRSMTGSISVGDAVVYTSKNEASKPVKGDVIIFDKNGTKTVHRVMSVNNCNGEARYYTKGDANSTMDEGYVTDKDIIGVVNFKIKYIGYPTLWVRELFNGDKER